MEGLVNLAVRKCALLLTINQSALFVLFSFLLLVVLYHHHNDAQFIQEKHTKYNLLELFLLTLTCLCKRKITPNCRKAMSIPPCLCAQTQPA